MLFAEVTTTTAAVLGGTVPPYFVWSVLVIAVGMLIWDTIEVGRNDAANLINAVFGARILTRRNAIRVAGVGVVLGAVMASSVIDTARKGIFDPTMLTLEQALCVYLAVYIVDTILLYGYSAFGMPVSTTATLVFELLGASFAIQYFDIVHWDKCAKVIWAIVMSIVMAGIMAFFVQRIVRGAIRDRTANLSVLLAHGGWIGGGMLAGLCYFLLTKGMKHLEFVKYLKESELFRGPYGAMVIVLILWAVFAVLIHMLLVVFGKRMARQLFPALAILGTIAMAFAFGQNDLANCASPGIAVITLFWAWFQGNADAVTVATEVEVHTALLGVCGILLFLGMMTKNAQRVTAAAVRAGSMGDHVKLWAPALFVRAAQWILDRQRRSSTLAPRPALSPRGKMMHYDSLRACVIMYVSASVIATASSLGYPVSTTYVAFSAIMATGIGDRIFQRGDSALKLGRFLWVVFCWFAAAAIASVSAGIVCRLIYHLSVPGILLGIGANLVIRRYVKKRSDEHEQHVREATEERMHPEEYAPEDG
ncbi:MAG: inorganic phosphate transporter [Phycisphaerae bacterium]|nr:inorganic phosphate transporter [Phycisphaerae bacterium]